MNAYEQKQEARRERILARVDKLRSEAARRSKRGWDDLHAIPFGQPILIGHHSEKRDRNYRRKACANIDKSVELNRAAGEAEARAAAIGTGGVSSDDPDGIEKLTEQLNERKAKQEKMGTANKLVRKKDKPGLIAMGYPERLVDKWLTEPSWGGKFRAYEPYELSNNSANIRRIEDRIKLLGQNAERETREEDYQGVVKMIENAEANRLQLIFPGKPSAEVRTKLKKSGFRWSPSEGAWQRHLNNSAIYWAKELIKEITQEGN